MMEKYPGPIRDACAIVVLLQLASCARSTAPSAPSVRRTPPLSSVAATLPAMPSSATHDDAGIHGDSALEDPIFAVLQAGNGPPVITFVDRPLPSPLPPDAQIEVRFDIVMSTQHTSLGPVEIMHGALRIPRLRIDRPFGGATAPTACDADILDDGHAMSFNCSSDSETGGGQGRVWVEGNRLMIQNGNWAPADRYTLPAGARVRFHPAHGSLGMPVGRNGS